jgi:hypothetical protein
LFGSEKRLTLELRLKTFASEDRLLLFEGTKQQS